MTPTRYVADYFELCEFWQDMRRLHVGSRANAREEFLCGTATTFCELLKADFVGRITQGAIMAEGFG